MAADFTIRAARPTEPDAQALIARHLGQMADQSPEESCHALDSSGLETPGVDFFLLELEGDVMGMGALAKLGSGAVELKSMHTKSEVRGSGAGRAMLAHLLDLARSKGASAVFLETGSTDDFLPARRLYESVGFRICGPFGDYGPDPWSVFMQLDLGPSADTPRAS
ncbi:acetyltransferase [Actibacterium atlanticum]|uniref:Acetyltransferase n=1 Tax=Actibacterium atlanticum TaxID=1461693 RepID=A0A058ZL62_9RHOB|nr:GNAT family N-acetyltransferase [Actibacterium atlanticum]KCV81942.1 acetyltransferase [Actibacterium atlanticum]